MRKDGFGLMLMEQFLKAWIFIIKMATRTITRLQTLKCLIDRNILKGIGPKEDLILISGGNNLLKPESGLKRRKEEKNKV